MEPACELCGRRIPKERLQAFQRPSAASSAPVKTDQTSRSGELTSEWMSKPIRISWVQSAVKHG